jgi:cytoskeletal protein CcmA (bactofilin family)
MKNGSELGTIIGEDATLEGKLSVQHAVRIDGKVNGELNSTDTITVGTTGQVEGGLTGENIVVGGQVEGTLKTNGLITLEAGSRFTGDLEATRLIIIEGATFNGRSTMGSGKPLSNMTPRKITLDPEPEIATTE